MDKFNIYSYTSVRLCSVNTSLGYVVHFVTGMQIFLQLQEFLQFQNKFFDFLQFQKLELWIEDIENGLWRSLCTEMAFSGHPDIPKSIKFLGVRT